MIRTSSRAPMRRITIISILLGLFAAAPGAWAQPFIIEGGRANAQIVVSQDVRRPRMAALGALELQKYLEKISGARLPIVPAPGDAAQVRIYVGQSERTEAMGITDEGLKHGAYRMVSGDDWLVLLGHDWDFQPPDPSALTRSQIDAHSFYRIAVNPAGAVYSLDMAEGGNSAGEAWVSQAEAAAHVGDDHWSVEMRLPLARDRGDPIHRVAARRIARKTYPWYFNVLDVRAIEGQKHISTFLDAEDDRFYDPATFAELSR